jgi:hypothetical protein
MALVLIGPSQRTEEARMERTVIAPMEPEDEALDPRVLAEFELEVPERMDPSEDGDEVEPDDEEEGDPAE